MNARSASRPRRALGALALALVLCSCSSLSITRETQTSGTFRSRAWAMTILSWDLPRPAMNIARENIADTRLVNLQVERAKVTPDNPYFNWLLDVLGVRVATITGTWGFSGGS